MPSRGAAPTGAPCWVDLQTSDVGRAREFYSAVLGWQALESSEEFGGYFMFHRNGVPVAGGMPSDAAAAVTDVWSVYLSVPDASATETAAVAAGGRRIVPPMPVADLGTMGFVSDPSGAAIGYWQPGTFQGFGLVAEHGAPSWFEVYTRDYEAACDFYRSVFGWRTEVLSDTDTFRYRQAMSEEGAVAGVMDASGWLPEGVPSHWVVYFGVDDTDAATATVGRLGGTVVEAPQDTPYGRIAHVTDPMGARFKLVAANDRMPARDAGT